MNHNDKVHTGMNHKENTFNKHEGHHAKMFLRKFWVVFVLTIPVVLYSDLPKKLLGWSAPEFFGSDYIPLILGSFIFFYGGWIFIQGAIREIKARLPGMMTLISIAITTAFLYSVFTTFYGGVTLFWELTTLILVMLFGHWVEMVAVASTKGALKELSKLMPDTAEVVRGDNIVKVSVEELKEGDIVFVRPGGRIPADGNIIDGESHIDESMISGESVPVAKSIGDEVIAGTINGDGAIKISVSKVGNKTFLSGVMKLVQEAQASKSRLQILSDRAAFYLTVIAVGAGSLTFITWFVLGAGMQFAIERLVVVLVIACPHALGLAVPLVASTSTSMAARNGFLVKQRLALEAARNIDVVLFDKTGTLTKGEYGVTNIWSFEGFSESDVLRFASSVDSSSEHFISKAIVKHAQEKGIGVDGPLEFKRIPGKGVFGIIDDKKVYVGGEAILDYAKNKDSLNREEIDREAKKGKTIIFVIVNGKVAGAFALSDVIRDESYHAIKKLKKMGVKVGMITGDSEAVASWVASDLGIDEYFAKVMPDQKAEKVKVLQDKGYKVAMVGDGINDAPALTQADLGIAIGAGTNVAIESAGIILAKNNPEDIAKIIRLSQLTYSKMMQNLFWATGYNVIAIPLAAGALATYGILLSPALGAIFMSLSSVIVAINAVLLKRKSLS